MGKRYVSYVCKNVSGDVRGVSWSFNAWGGEYDGLYMDWENDDKAAGIFCDKAGIDYYDASPFVLEGGSIHSDGEGTVIVTESCLLSKGRNPELNKSQIENRLKEYLGAKKLYGFLMAYIMMKRMNTLIMCAHLHQQPM